MTPEDYNRIALAIRRARAVEPDMFDGPSEAIDEVMLQLADVLAGDYPHFNRAEFLHACRSDLT